MSFYDELSKLYFNEITPSPTYSELCSIGNKISWYMADSQNNIVNAIGNNTNYIIDLQMGVLDTYVEIIKGMGIIINQITILNKGALESSGFAAQ